MFKHISLVTCLLISGNAHARLRSGEAHVWEMQEITLESARAYRNPYVDVTVWIELTGPGFSKKVYGYWDGGRTFKVRFVATTPRPKLTNLNPGARYEWTWFEPETGHWGRTVKLRADSSGAIAAPEFPASVAAAARDAAAKLVISR